MTGNPETSPEIERNDFEPTMGVKIVEIGEGLAMITLDDEHPVDQNLINKAILAGQEEVELLFDVEIPLQDAIDTASDFNLIFFETNGFFLEKEAERWGNG